MILRLTARLGKKIGVFPSRSLPAEPNPFADWTAHLFTAERVQYILITNTASLYSMVTYGAGITSDSSFLARMTSCMGEFIRDDGHEAIFERHISPSTAQIFLSKTLNRAVTGSMNDLAFNAKTLIIERQISPYDVSFLLNQILMSYLKYKVPREAFESLALEAEKSAGQCNARSRRIAVQTPMTRLRKFPRTNSPSL
ncbi:MAG: hypothetical protein V2A74_13420 [bacterium]